jgi:hypothetical protein
MRIPAIVLTCLASASLTASAWAAPITVNNPSFEILPAAGLTESCGPSCRFSIDFIPGWINTPFLGLGLNSGQARFGVESGDTTFFDTLSDGPTSAYTSIPGIEQTVAATVQSGVTYTLLVDVGWRKDASPTGVPRLKVNNLFYDGVGVPVLGGWATYMTTYVGRPEDVGLPITIFLDSASFQGNFDNVRLSDSTDIAAVPEPATFGLLGVGLLAVLTKRRLGRPQRASLETAGRR